MYGAIIGDIAGSCYEVCEILAKKSNIDTINERYTRRIKIMNSNTPLFGANSSYTDDTVLTIAILDTVLNNGNFEEYLRAYGQKEIKLGEDIYGRSRFGSGFVEWLLHKRIGNSDGNGCAMRISPIGFMYDDLEKVKIKTKEATIPSHNHANSLLCAEAVSTSIFLIRKGMSKEELKKYITANYFSLDYDLEELRKNYIFTSKAILSVPIAVYAFLISNNFEDAIRKAISCGGDCDTIACITGALAESYYGINEELITKANKYLPEEYIDMLNRAYQNNHIRNRRNYYVQ